MRKITVLLFLLASISFANLEINPADDGSGLMWLTWVDTTDTAVIARYNQSSLDDYRMMGGTPEGVSSTLLEDASGDLHLILSYSNTLFSLDPTGIMPEEASVNFDYFVGEWYTTGLLRRNTDPSSGLLGRFLGSYMSSGTEFFWITREFTVASTGVITMGDSLMQNDPYPVTTDKSIEVLVSMLNPVVNETGYPVMATRHGLPGWYPNPGHTMISTQCHNTTASTAYLSCDTLTNSTLESPEPLVIASGSCSDYALFLWSDSTENVLFSEHNCENAQVVSTTAFPGQGPSFSDPSAMSCNPLDTGLLLVWYSEGSVMCRHFSDNWNSFAYEVDGSVNNIDKGNITVCSVEDGYWVAWLAGSSDMPELIFVNRDDVTSTEVSEEPIEPLSFSQGPNPFSEQLSISVQGASGQISAAMYDCSGRLVRKTSFSPGETLLWQTSELPGGSYIIRIVSEGESCCRKAVLLH